MSTTDAWLHHFHLLLRSESRPSEAMLVAGLMAFAALIVAAVSGSGRQRRLAIVIAAVALAVALINGAGYALVAAQFRGACVRANRAVVSEVPTYPGSSLEADEVDIIESRAVR